MRQLMQIMIVFAILGTCFSHPTWYTIDFCREHHHCSNEFKSCQDDSGCFWQNKNYMSCLHTISNDTHVKLSEFITLNDKYYKCVNDSILHFQNGKPVPVQDNLYQCTKNRCANADYPWNSWLLIDNCIKYREENVVGQNYSQCMNDENCYFTLQQYKKCVDTCLPPSFIQGANKNKTLTDTQMLCVAEKCKPQYNKTDNTLFHTLWTSIYPLCFTDLNKVHQLNGTNKNFQSNQSTEFENDIQLGRKQSDMEINELAELFKTHQPLLNLLQHLFQSYIYRPEIYIFQKFNDPGQFKTYMQKLNYYEFFRNDTQKINKHLQNNFTKYFEEVIKSADFGEFTKLLKFMKNATHSFNYFSTRQQRAMFFNDEFNVDAIEEIAYFLLDKMHSDDPKYIKMLSDFKGSILHQQDDNNIYQAQKIMEKHQNYNTTMVWLILISAAAFIIILLAIIFIVKCHKNKNQKKPTKREIKINVEMQKSQKYGIGRRDLNGKIATLELIENRGDIIDLNENNEEPKIESDDKIDSDEKLEAIRRISLKKYVSLDLHNKANLEDDCMKRSMKQMKYSKFNEKIDEHHELDSCQLQSKDQV